MLKILSKEKYKNGEKIFKEGGGGDWLYIILSGKVEISKSVEGKDYILEILEPGDIFGEIEFLASPPRITTAIAIGETTLGLIDRELLDNEFNKLSTEFKSMLKSFATRFNKIVKRIESFKVRQWPRVPKLLNAELKDDKSSVDVQIEDISTHGLFVKTNSLYSQGEKFSINLEFLLRETLNLTCEVIWSRRQENCKKGQSPGMGIKFLDMDDKNRNLLKEYLNKTLKESSEP